MPPVAPSRTRTRRDEDRRGARANDASIRQDTAVRHGQADSTRAEGRTYPLRGPRPRAARSCRADVGRAREARAGVSWEAHVKTKAPKRGQARFSVIFRARKTSAGSDTVFRMHQRMLDVFRENGI